MHDLKSMAQLLSLLHLSLRSNRERLLSLTQFRLHCKSALSEYNHESIVSGDLASARELLDQGHDINGRDDHEDTAIHVAVTRFKVEMVGLLVDQGADLEARN